MVNFTVTYDRDVIDAIGEKIANAPRAIQLYAQKTVPALIRRTLTPLITEPRQPSLPFIWSYDPVRQARARRWYFANKVKGGGTGRYVRTHELVNNWTVTGAADTNGGVITVSNDTPGLEYVQGARQVPSHRESGWARYEDVLLNAEQQANDLVIDFWLQSVIG